MSAVLVLVVLGYVVMLVSLLAIGVISLWWQLWAWRTPGDFEQTRYHYDGSAPRLSFSLIVPARHEQAVLGDTLDQLASLDHPDYEVLVVIGHDDEDTLAIARGAELRHPDIIRVVIDTSWPKNKPKALNTALPHCSGDVVGVFDAEDEVHPDLLRRVDDCFRTSGAPVIQSGVQLMNFESSWYSVHNCLEYFFWFRSRLHFHAATGFIPLGGNTVFVRRHLLVEVGGWDPECLTEDCELGVRLSSMGAPVRVVYDPRHVTMEETPDSLSSLFKQRTRWDQGFLQVLKKGDWRGLPSWRQRWLARYTLATPFLQAWTGLIVPVAILTVLVAKVPVVIAMLSFLPAVPMFVSLVFQLAALREFADVYYVRPGPKSYARLVIGFFPYQLVLAAAALRAIRRERAGEYAWEKTRHLNAHRVDMSQA